MRKRWERRYWTTLELETAAFVSSASTDDEEAAVIVAGAAKEDVTSVADTGAIAELDEASAGVDSKYLQSITKSMQQSCTTRVLVIFYSRPGMWDLRKDQTVKGSDNRYVVFVYVKW